MRLRAGIVLAISLLSTFLLAAAAPSPGQLSDGFPLEQGTYWTYECDTTRKDRLTDLENGIRKRQGTSGSGAPNQGGLLGRKSGLQSPVWLSLAQWVTES